MPPRTLSHHLGQIESCQCFRTRPFPLVEPPSEPRIRRFHASSPTNGHPTRSRQRKDMFAWLNGPGKNFRNPLPGSTNYMGAYDGRGNLKRKQEQRNERFRTAGRGAEVDEDGNVIEERQPPSSQRDKDQLPAERPSDLRPYPLNRDFLSQRVLSENLRERLYQLIVEQGMDLKSVSAAYGVDIRRAAAVARLKTIEKQWVKDGKGLATPYSKAVLAMLPQTPFRPDSRKPEVHEPINDLPVHAYTRHQMFVSTSESRDFTRSDAAEAFHPKLLPADKRIPHPELVEITKWELAGFDRETRLRMMRERDEESARKREEKEQKQQEWEARTQRVFHGRRWDFKFQDYSAERVGKDGRARDAVGLRYGMPHEDRKRGQVKIPTRVE